MPPRCHNRPPAAVGRWYPTGRTVQNGTRTHPGAPVVWGPVKPVLRWYPRWFEDRCAVWDGTGIGATPETARYPQAHGWDCRGCRWLPGFARELVR